MNPPITTMLSGEGQSAQEIKVQEGAFVSDKARLWGKHASTATGTVKYAVYADEKCEELVAEAGEVAVEGEEAPTSSTLKLKKGTYFWHAEYSGDVENPSAASSCGAEVLLVVQPTSLTTSLYGEGKEGEEVEVKEGTAVKDTATLSGESTSMAEGSVSYVIYGDSECTELVTFAGDVDVSEGNVPSSEEVALPHGTYYWQAEYTGDKANGGSMSACGSEIAIVTAPITTRLSGEKETGEEIEVLEGAPVTDKATLHGEHAAEATGTVKYAVYKDDECKELVAEAGEVTVEGAEVPVSNPVELKEEGTYFWQAEYSGDEKNPKATSTCGGERGLIVNPAVDKFAAIGDSYSSGEGVRWPAAPPGARARGTYYRATDIGAVWLKHTANRCHRSRHAWPALIAEAIWGEANVVLPKVFEKQPDHFIFRACSGAETINLWRAGGGVAAAEGGQSDELLTPPHKWRSTRKPAQDLWLGLPGGKFPFTGNNNLIRAVTMTIGGNDAGFGDIAAACYQVWNPLVDYSPVPCQNEIAARRGVGFPAIQARLPVVLAHIRQIAPQARIRIPLYPQVLNMALRSIPVGPALSINNAIPGNGGLTAAQSLERFLRELNQTITATVRGVDPRGAWVKVIPATVRAFENAGVWHRLGDAQPWINGILIAHRRESFHPNRCGHIAIARMVLPVIRRGVAGPAAC